MGINFYPFFLQYNKGNIPAGIVYGRNIIQHTNPAGMTRALMAIVHDGATTAATAVQDLIEKQRVSTIVLADIGRMPGAAETVLTEWIENGGTGFQHASGDTMYYNPAGTGSFTLQMAADDAGSGVAHVAFPNLGTNWTPPAATTDTTGAPHAMFDFSRIAPSIVSRALCTSSSDALNFSTSVCICISAFES